MNFKKLQQIQAKLDEAILKEKAPMTAEERFNKTLVALSVEIAEVANTVEHFKFWKDNKGKVDSKRFSADNTFGDTGETTYSDSKEGRYVTFAEAHKLTLIEECSDALHFILSLANQCEDEIEIKDWKVLASTKEANLMYINRDIAKMFKSYDMKDSISLNHNMFMVALGVFSFFNQLGITQQELEQAYYDKNKVNYDRLKNGY